ncbi:MAG: tetratricopeptide repeat protein [bacterium]
MKDYKKAREIAEKVAMDFPSLRGDASYWLSEAHKEEGNFEESLAYAKKALEASKEGGWFISRAKMNWAYALEHLGKFEEAEKKYKELSERHIDQRPLALLGVGNCAFCMEEYQTALEALDKLLSEYPEAASEIREEAEFIKGKCYLALGYEPQQIISQFHKIVRKYPRTRVAAGSQLQIMLIYLSMINAPDLAKKELDDILRNYKENFPDVVFMALSRWGSFAFEKGKYQEAIENYAKAAEVYPSFTPQALLRIGNCYRLAGSLDEAIRTFQQIIDRYPDSKFRLLAMLFKGQCLYKKGQREEAIKIFREIIDTYPGSEEFSEAKEWLEFLKGDMNEK